MDFSCEISISLLQDNLWPSYLFDIMVLSMATDCDVMHGQIMRSKSAQDGAGEEVGKILKLFKVSDQKKWKTCLELMQ